MSSNLAPLEIGPPGPTEIEQALELAWRHVGRTERSVQIARLIADARVKPEELRGLLAARRAGQLVGSVWAQLQPGRSAFLSLPHLSADEPAHTASALLAAVLEILMGQQTRLVQALIVADFGEEFDLLLAAGFEHYADLLYMAATERTFPAHLPPAPLEFAAYDDHQQDRLARLLQSTYVGSLDCPRLNGVREIADVITGYRSTGTFSPARWLFVRRAESDIGCLLLAEHPQYKQWEVAYVGLVPEARGRGWGIATVRHAQWLARRAGMDRLLLAVDAANQPAIATYAAAGFTAWDRRSVMLRIFPDVPADRRRQSI
jgi:mycothiol synthase